MGFLMLRKLGFVNKFLLALMSTQLVLSVPFATMYISAVSWLVMLVAVPAVISGLGLLRYSEWARVLGLLVALVAILILPLGTLLGAYGIWVLLSPESEWIFLEPPPRVRTRR